MPADRNVPLSAASLNEPVTDAESLRTSRRSSMIQRRTSRLGNRKVLYIPFNEKLFISLAFLVQLVILALLIAAAVTDVFKVDGSRAIDAGANLENVSAALDVTITAGTHPFCYSLWGAHKCSSSGFHRVSWFAERGTLYGGYPSKTTQTMMLGSAAFAVIAVCYSVLNLAGIVVVVFMQDFTAVLCAWSFSVWITILISWALTVGVYARGMTSMPSSTIAGRNVHVKDYCSFTTSFALTMTCFGLHAIQFAFTVTYTQLFENRVKSLVDEQKKLAEQH